MKQSGLILLVAVALLFAVSTSSHAAFAKESITVANSAIGFTAATVASVLPLSHGNSVAATCSLEPTGGDIRFWVDGSTPTTTEGHLWPASSGMILEFTGEEVTRFRAIRTAGVSGVLKCSYR